MGCRAVLIKIHDKEKTRLKLPSWTSKDVDEIINDVTSGIERVITSRNCYRCKEDFEKHDAAEVRIDKDSA